jgi:hypothetical protein
MVAVLSNYFSRYQKPCCFVGLILTYFIKMPKLVRCVCERQRGLKNMRTLDGIQKRVDMLPSAPAFDEIRTLLQRYARLPRLTPGNLETADGEDDAEVRRLEAVADDIVGLATRLRIQLQKLISGSAQIGSSTVLAAFEQRHQALVAALEDVTNKRSSLAAQHAAEALEIRSEIESRVDSFNGAIDTVDQSLASILYDLGGIELKYHAAVSTLLNVEPQAKPYPLELVRVENRDLLDCRREGVFSSGDIIQLEGTSHLYFVEGLDQEHGVRARPINSNGGFSDRVIPVEIGSRKRYTLIDKWGDYKIGKYGIDPETERENLRIVSRRDASPTESGFPFKKVSFIDGQGGVNVVSAHLNWRQGRSVKDRNGEALKAGDLVKTLSERTNLFPHLGIVLGAAVDLDDQEQYQGQVWIARARDARRHQHSPGMTAWVWRNTEDIVRVRQWGEFDLADYDFNPHERWRFAHVSHKTND